ncbi:IS1595 family transposase [Luteolibacter ambystomatis]|uniref:IS1595 family transposase n=1 Tax=Luteolibacter ambystomatis TaxID=2824561 RepID=A0A975PGU6_9BACT|nr:IS1595 family transposase [Luteolibacter ambystomatis]QUE52631.1 IS1595 family transposase [Luteolibacter ambystomatis]
MYSFNKIFPDEAAAIAFLENARWPDGNIQSPYGDKGAYRIETRPGVYKCRATRKQFSVRQGTIFEESRLPLHKWFYAIFLTQSTKKGVSSIHLANVLGVTQKTAWFMMHRLRYGVEHGDCLRPLSGIVEMDEHYSGGKGRGKRGRGAENKTPVFGMVERGGEVRVQVVPDCKKKTLIPIIKKHVSTENTEVMTDDFPTYNALDGMYDRQVINHSAKQYVRADGHVHTNTIEGFWSHLKLGLKAVQIHVRPKHLNRYCKEYEFKYNTRKLTNFERFSRWFDFCNGRLTYKALTA